MISGNLNVGVLVSNASHGATIVLHRRFVPDEVGRALVEHGVTMFFAVPTIYIGFLAARETSG